MTRRVIQVCNVVMEVTWLLALVSIPLYFNIYTSRVFEPDKIALFRSLVLIIGVAWLLKAVALRAAVNVTVATRANPRRVSRPPREEFLPDGEVIGPDNLPLFQRIATRPLVLPAYILTFAYIAATLISVVPGVSLWGSYDRLEGTYTFLSYVVFFLAIVFNLRERRQIERIISFILLTNVPVSIYGVMQHYKADPLPWQGDTTFRVTSTMGNAIFIAAYLIMVVPIVVYRILTTGRWLLENRANASRSNSGRARNIAFSWFGLYAFFFIFELGLFYVILNLNANYRPESTGVAQNSTQQLIDQANTAAGNSNQLVGGTSIGPIWSLPLVLLISFGIFFMFTVKRKDTDNNFLFRLGEFGCYILLLGLILAVIVFSKSRGPLAGMLVGLYILPPLLFATYKRWRWLTGWLGVGILGGVLLLLFNLPQGSTPLEPVFSTLRQNPEIARFGEFLQTEDGTGRVRRLIWQTDFELLGDTAAKDPLRLLLGHGPESMYYISPQFYQPELGWFEARNAIPDRSHNAYLDALVNTGIFGFVAYLGFVLLFFYYSVKFLRRSRRYEYRVLLACLIAGMLSHLVEIFTGIQVVSSFMMFFLFAGLVAVLGGLVQGSHASNVEATMPVPVEEKVVEKVAASSKRTRGNERVVAPARVTTVRGSSAVSGQGYFDTALLNVPESSLKVWFWTVSGAVIVLTLYFTVVINWMPIVADVAFKQGQNLFFSKRSEEAAIYYKQAASTAPTEDRYALFLGQAYVDLADKVRQADQQKKAQNQQADPNAQNQILGYLHATENELLRARDLAPLNPDHYSNLARMYGSWVTYEPTKRKELVAKQLDWYDKAVAYAPRNVRVWSEYAIALINSSRATDGSVDQAVQDHAIKTGEESVKIDRCYDFGRWVLGDIYLGAGRNDDAAIQFGYLSDLNPKELINNQRYLQRIQVMAQSKQIDQALMVQTLLKPLAPVAIQSSQIGQFTNSCLEIPRPYVTTPPTDPDKAYYNQTAGIYLFHLERLSEAEQRLNLANQLDATSAYTHAYLAAIYQKTARTDLAQKEYQKALDLSAQNTDTKVTIQGFLSNYFKA
ncbi:MAG: O-antigen ligase family protein [Chloroflexi bacterium]|uniref:O-antigen ligase family protein n=1 Tax=Candidatus Chlorohelix allophototropha TaxID=3003348 RepID=A0A8T7M1H6_9CHLR|nr:O-antigen ligase family protein [Chloroflexota bacterium]WJW67830.1 O-antigen ligase family protein [Chloroflexota bacterium L227-S17]